MSHTKVKEYEKRPNSPVNLLLLSIEITKGNNRKSTKRQRLGDLGVGGVTKRSFKETSTHQEVYQFFFWFLTKEIRNKTDDENEMRTILTLIFLKSFQLIFSTKKWNRK